MLLCKAVYVACFSIDKPYKPPPMPFTRSNEKSSSTRAQRKKYRKIVLYCEPNIPLRPVCNMEYVPTYLYLVTSIQNGNKKSSVKHTTSYYSYNSEALICESSALFSSQTASLTFKRNFYDVYWL